MSAGPWPDSRCGAGRAVPRDSAVAGGGSAAAGLTGGQDQVLVELVRHDGLRQVPARSREKAELCGAAPAHR